MLNKPYYKSFKRYIMSLKRDHKVEKKKHNNNNKSLKRDTIFRVGNQMVFVMIQCTDKMAKF